MPSATWSSMMACLPLANWQNGSVPTLAVRMNLILLFPKSSRDYALAPQNLTLGFRRFALAPVVSRRHAQRRGRARCSRPSATRKDTDAPRGCDEQLPVLPLD